MNAQILQRTRRTYHEYQLHCVRHHYFEGLEPVRKRPGMYIGGVGEAGLHHLVWEVLDNAVDEVINGHAGDITVHLEQDAKALA